MTDSGGARTMDPAEVLALLCACRTWRDRAFFGSMALLGLRVAEACALRVGDLYLPDGTVRAVANIRRSSVKGCTVSRQVPVPADLVRLLAYYWTQLRDRSPDAPAWPARTGGQGIGVRAASKAFQGAARRAHLPRCSTHSLRKFYAVELSRNGTEVRVISALLGHASISTTDRYLRQVEEWERVQGARSISLPVVEVVDEVLRRLQRPPAPVVLLPTADRRNR